MIVVVLDSLFWDKCDRKLQTRYFIHIAINITSFNTYKKSKEKTKNEYPTKPKLQTLEHGAIVDGFDKFR